MTPGSAFAPQLSQNRAPGRSGAPHWRQNALAATGAATGVANGGAPGGAVVVSAASGVADGVSVFDSRGSFERSMPCFPSARLPRLRLTRAPVAPEWVIVLSLMTDRTTDCFYPEIEGN